MNATGISRIKDALLILALLLGCLPLFNNPRKPERFVPGQVIQATVSVVTKQYASGINSRGTGALISDQGYILTNYHAVGDALSADICFFDGTVKKARVVAVDSTVDLALLKVSGFGQPYFPLCRTDSLRIGDSVFAIGNPSEQLVFSFTNGVISGFERSLALCNKERFIQTNVTLSSGCSGGPLFNDQGELIGINTAVWAKNGYFNGYSFAVPLSLIREFLEQCYADGAIPMNFAI